MTKYTRDKRKRSERPWRLVQERLVQERPMQRSLESNESEMTETSGNVMGISQFNKKEQNITRLGNMMWIEKSQNNVKSSLPEVKEPNAAESCQKDGNDSIPVDDVDTEIPTESCSGVARNSEEMMKRSPHVVKAGVAEVTNHATQVVVEDMVKLSTEGVAEETTEACDDDANKPVMEEATRAAVVETAAKKPSMTESCDDETTEPCDVVTREPDEVKIENIEEPNDGGESCRDDARNYILAGVAGVK